MTEPLPRLAYLIDPRFRGGTSTSFLAELAVMAPLARLIFHASSAGFLRGQGVNPAVADALEKIGAEVVWDSKVVAGDAVVIHNPIFLSTYAELPFRIVARKVIVVTHENFMRPGGHEGFDFARLVDVIGRASTATEKWLAPVSPVNRDTVAAWISGRNDRTGWRLFPADCTNVVGAPMRPPTRAPRDRRGRLSREGLEKFPPLADMDLAFPPHAERNILMGTDLLGAEEHGRRHWTLLPFGALGVDAFFDEIDFMVYFTAPTWAESFGRVIAEAITAGKIVIAGPDAGRIFGDGVIVARPRDVDGIIARLIADPAAYGARVMRAQAALAAYRPAAFLSRIAPLLEIPEPA